LNAVEPTFGTSRIGPLEWYFNSGPFAVPGAAGALYNNYYRSSAAYPNPDDPAYRPPGIDRLFWVTNGPSYRLTIDLGDLDGARIVSSSGQSGNPFDRHYGDLLPAWANGGTVPLPFSASAIARGAAATLTLTP
jgi:penicillin amidase